MIPATEFSPPKDFVSFLPNQHFFVELSEWWRQKIILASHPILSAPATSRKRGETKSHVGSSYCRHDYRAENIGSVNIKDDAESPRLVITELKGDPLFEVLWKITEEKVGVGTCACRVTVRINRNQISNQNLVEVIYHEEVSVLKILSLILSAVIERLFSKKTCLPCFMRD